MGRKRRQQDYLRAFNQAIAHALREDVDGVIHTGNLFWTKSPPAEIMEECRKALSRLSDAGIPLWLVYGHRDPGLAVLRDLQEEGLLRRLGAEWQTIGDVAVCGIDTQTNPGALNQPGHVSPRQPRIVCSYDEISVHRLRDAIGADIDAVLLGNQIGPVSRTENGCWIFSPGSPERVLGKWMTEPTKSEWSHPRRVNIYTFEGSSICVESPRLETRDYEGLALETDKTTTIEDIRHRLDQVDFADKAGLLILRGVKGSKSPSRKRIQKELCKRCEIARVYDHREDLDETEDGRTSSSKRRGDSNPISAETSDESEENSSGATPSEEPDTATDSNTPAGARESSTPIDVQTGPSDSIEFTPNDIARLDTPDDESPDSAHVAAKFDRLRTQIEAAFANTAWFDSFTWRGDPGSPYIGPPDSEQSQYVWFGLAHETYQPLGKPTRGLQFEFGIDRGSARGFFDRSVICGLYFGPWATDEVVSNIVVRLRNHCDDLATFLENNPKYVLATKNDVWDNPTPNAIADRAHELADGFTITVDLTLDDLYAEDAIAEQVCRSIYEVLPLYAKLAGVEESAQAYRPTSNWRNDTSPAWTQPADSRLDEPTSGGSKVEPTIESIEDYSSLLDAENIRTTVERLTERGASQKEALQYVRQYAVDMERGEGLYAVKGLGPVAGHSLARAGITDLDGLLESSLSDLMAVEGIRESQEKTIMEAVRAGNVASSAADSSAESSSTTVSDAPSNTSADEKEYRGASTPASDATGSSSRQSDADLPVVTHDGQDIHANQLSEYYEAIRCVRKVIETVMKLPGTDIDPEDLTDPRVQYYVMLDACIGLGQPELTFTGYGQQHQDRLPFGIREYRHAYGDGDWVTEYHAISVVRYCDETQTWLGEQTWLEDPQRFVRPCAPDGDQPLPEMVGSLEDLRHALAILDTFPAYPPLPMETGTTERTIPIESLYLKLFSDVADDHLVDVDTLSGPGQATGDPITGPVADATPTSQADAESFLLDYGKLTHLFQRVMPPGSSPIQQALPVFGLDWYRPKSGCFDELQDLAKYGRDEPIALFRPRLQDMVHRRFLRDRWNYDYITVFPGHEEGQLSPQLVELAKDAVIETSIIYAPLLERTETTERQREKSREGRKEVARDPGATLKARANLDGETVILLDDISTSGNSLLAGAHLLREAGAGRVIGLTLGFTPGKPEKAVKEIKKPDAFASDIIAGLE